MEYSPDGDDDGGSSDIKKEHETKNHKGGDKVEKRGMINRVNRECGSIASDCIADYSQSSLTGACVSVLLSSEPPFLGAGKLVQR